MARAIVDIASWLLFQGYVTAFLLGVMIALQIVIWQNARTIRRNADLIQRGRRDGVAVPPRGLRE